MAELQSIAVNEPNQVEVDLENPCAVAQPEPVTVVVEPEIPEYVDWIVVCSEDLDENGEFTLFDPGMIPLAGVFPPKARAAVCH